MNNELQIVYFNLITINSKLRPKLISFANIIAGIPQILYTNYTIYGLTAKQSSFYDSNSPALY